MSNKGARKSYTAAVTEEKEKRTDSPVKEMKKKIAANAEKEKQTADKAEKTVTPPEKSDKNSEKVTEKPQNEKTDKKAQNNEKVDNKKAQTNEKVDNKKAQSNEKVDNKKAQSNEKVDSKKVQNEKVDKSAAPTPEKNAQKPDKSAEKSDKSEKDKPAEKSDKKTEKVADKADKKAEKPTEKKTEPEKKEDTNGDGKDQPVKLKQNGAANVDANGVDTVSERDSSEEELVIDEHDEMFPELTYDDTSEGEEDAPSRSLTRRSQVKSTKTPETPRPASCKEDDSKEKVLKMNDSLATDRKLRSSDSPKREPKKPDSKKAQDSPKNDKTIDLTEDDEKSGEKEKSSGKNQLEMDVVIEVESIDETSESRGRTRARVSPYTRPRHDQTASSMMANYTGNNTTMEMDLTETSSILEDNLDDSAYLRGLRTIRGRSSYKPLKALSLKHTLNRSTRSANSLNTSLLDTSRPTGTVVGRKRKPDADHIELASEATEAGEVSEAGELAADITETLHAQNKRMRLFERIAGPFRGFNTRTAEIVGINTDLPLTAPVASPPVFDPESLKTSSEPIAVPLPTPTHDADSKRCVVM